MNSKEKSKTIDVVARREVIMTAGALNTPRLLQISGIGGASDLASILGVQPLIDRPGVGRNLRVTMAPERSCVCATLRP